MFAACSSQWRTGASGRESLDYTAVQTVSGIEGVKLTRKLFSKIRWLEIGAIAAYRGRDLSDILNG